MAQAVLTTGNKVQGEEGVTLKQFVKMLDNPKMDKLVPKSGVVEFELLKKGDFDYAVVVNTEDYRNSGSSEKAVNLNKPGARINVEVARDGIYCFAPAPRIITTTVGKTQFAETASKTRATLTGTIFVARTEAELLECKKGMISKINEDMKGKAGEDEQTINDRNKFLNIDLER